MNKQYKNTCTVINNLVNCFDELTEEEKQLVEKSKVTVTYKKGETICKQGAFASHIIYLKEGLCKIYLEGKDKNLILKISPSNHLIGLPQFMMGTMFFYILLLVI